MRLGLFSFGPSLRLRRLLGIVRPPDNLHTGLNESAAKRLDPQSVLCRKL